MSIVETAAIATAREFVQARHGIPWDESSLEVYPDEIEGRSVWVVKASDATPDGEDAWMHPIWQPVLYFIDRETGKMFGFATERSKTIFRQTR